MMAAARAKAMRRDLIGMTCDPKRFECDNRLLERRGNQVGSRWTGASRTGITLGMPGGYPSPSWVPMVIWVVWGAAVLLTIVVPWWVMRRRGTPRDLTLDDLGRLRAEGKLSAEEYVRA